MRIDINDLSSAITEELEAYSEEIEEKIDKKIDDVSKKLVAELKSDPDIPENTGKYKKSFYFKKVAKGKGFKRNVVANKKHQLTHLLEDGHLTRGGTSRTKAFPHWKKAEKWAEELMEGVVDEL